MQELIVALIVVTAAGYSLWRFAPAALRLGAARGLARLAQRSGASSTVARRIEIRVANTAGGCGDCAANKGCSARLGGPLNALRSSDSERDGPRCP